MKYSNITKNNNYIYILESYLFQRKTDIIVIIKYKFYMTLNPIMNISYILHIWLYKYITINHEFCK